MQHGLVLWLTLPLSSLFSPSINRSCPNPCLLRLIWQLNGSLPPPLSPHLRRPGFSLLDTSLLMTSDHARYCCSTMVPSCYHNPYSFSEGPVHRILHHYHCSLRDSLHITEEYLLSSRRIRMLLLTDSPFVFLSKSSHRPSIPSSGTYFIMRRYRPLISCYPSVPSRRMRCLVCYYQPPTFLVVSLEARRTTMDNPAHKLMGL